MADKAGQHQKRVFYVRMNNGTRAIDDEADSETDAFARARRFLSYLPAGSYVGEMALIDGGMRTATPPGTTWKFVETAVPKET